MKKKNYKFGYRSKGVIRFDGYKDVVRTVYFTSGSGTYIMYKNKKEVVYFTQWNNSFYTERK